ERARQALDSGGTTLQDAQALHKLKDHPDRLARALREGALSGEIPGTVEAELDGYRRERARAEAEERLRAAGATIVAWPQDGFYGRKEAVLRQPDAWAFMGKRLDLTVEAHASEP